MDAQSLKTAWKLEPRHITSPGGVIAVIESVDTEYYEERENGRIIEKCRHQLLLRGCRLPLRLNNPRVDVLIEMFGEDTDKWVGRKIGLYTGKATVWGKTETVIFLHEKPVDSSEPTPWPQELASNRRPAFNSSSAPSGNPFGAPAFNPGTPPPAGAITPAPGPGPGRDTRILGPKNAERLLAALREQGASVDLLMDWMKRTDQDAWQAMYGKPLEDYPVWVAALCQRFLKEFATPSSPPAPPQVSIPNDDIPF